MTRSRIVLVSLLPLVATLLGCTRSEPPASSTPGASPSPHVYELRGQILFVPERGKAAQIFIEPIPDWVDEEGDVVGMEPMAMTWPLADGVSTAGLEPTDIVAFTLEVDWQAETPARITAIEELPPDTELAYGDSVLTGSAATVHDHRPSTSTADGHEAHDH